MSDNLLLIQSEAYPNGSRVHLAQIKELRGDKTGTVIRTYHVKACDGRSLGGSYGVLLFNGGVDDIGCARCHTLALAQVLGEAP